MLPIPASVAANIERMIISFLWFGEEGGKKPCNVKWASSVRPQKHGGLGIGSIRPKSKLKSAQIQLKLILILVELILYF